MMGLVRALSCAALVLSVQPQTVFAQPVVVPEALADGWVKLEIIDLSVEIPQRFLAPELAAVVYDDGLGGESAHFSTAIEDMAFVLRNTQKAYEDEDAFALVLAPYENAAATTITYEVDEPNFGVVSGYRGENIFYEVCKARGDRFHCFALEYPETERPLVDESIARMVRSLR